jgi:hypothetical protein
VAAAGTLILVMVIWCVCHHFAFRYMDELRAQDLLPVSDLASKPGGGDMGESAVVEESQLTPDDKPTIQDDVAVTVRDRLSTILDDEPTVQDDGTIIQDEEPTFMDDEPTIQLFIESLCEPAPQVVVTPTSEATSWSAVASPELSPGRAAVETPAHVPTFVHSPTPLSQLGPVPVVAMAPGWLSMSPDYPSGMMFSPAAPLQQPAHSSGFGLFTPAAPLGQPQQPDPLQHPEELRTGPRGRVQILQEPRRARRLVPRSVTRGQLTSVQHPASVNRGPYAANGDVTEAPSVGSVLRPGDSYFL